MIDCMAAAWLNECYQPGRVFVSYSSDGVADCGDEYVIVAPESDRVERGSCGAEITEIFSVEVVNRVQPNDTLAALNVAHARAHREALMEVLEGWLPGDGYGPVQIISGGFSAVTNNQARWRFQFQTKRRCTLKITNELQQKWNGMIRDE